ncbi:roadblock/LC7 domain-containing protein [Streptomyces sp. MTZ3.1]|uniref:Roadblock/LC7 domain-containing protein n=1 Tax=Streptomyces meridianus TaxID=2938945 RepID=A0ABT0X9T0_9ACTN|nr:roadblock/LC7 domain-containing protein [Streptomyces meridianus]MCM2579279.1 roadblock/LC7 domain-containing protein [Streptomyces meridianus]
MSKAADDLQWLLTGLVEGVPGIRSVAVVSSDGVLLLATDPGPAGAGEDGPSPDERSAGLATVVSGLGALTDGASELIHGGDVKQTVITMDEGSVFVMSISDGSLLGVEAAPDCDASAVAYHMSLFVGRAGHVLTPELRNELTAFSVRDR